MLAISKTSEFYHFQEEAEIKLFLTWPESSGKNSNCHSCYHADIPQSHTDFLMAGSNVWNGEGKLQPTHSSLHLWGELLTTFYLKENNRYRSQEVGDIQLEHFELMISMYLVQICTP